MTIWGGGAAMLVFGALSLLVIRQVMSSLHRLRPQAEPAAAPRRWPRAEVVLSLKGTDPFLDRCLEQLAAQDYPDYRVTVVVDSRTDPAWEQAVAAQARFGPEIVEVVARVNDSATCTRKLNNLLTAFETLPAAAEVVALCDGDAVVHATWLKDLVSGLSDPDIAAVSANRWYAPTGCGLAEISRYYWNALAVPTTHQHRILWGGSLALRRTIVDEPEFRRTFAEGFADDTLIASYLERTGRRYEVLGATYVINSETTSVGNYWNFLVRQMLCVRLHHPRWRPIFLHALTLAVSVGVLLPSLLAAELTAGVSGVLAFCVYGVTLAMLTGLYELRLRSAFPELRTLHVDVTVRRVLMALPALLFTSIIYPAATIVAACTSSHLWRGIEYRLVNGKVASILDRSELPCMPPTRNFVRRPRFLSRSVHKDAA